VSKSKKVTLDDKEQSKLFIEKAREIGADEEKSAADTLMGQLAKLPPEPRIKPKIMGNDNERLNVECHRRGVLGYLGLE
jgi:hypothetical protein